MNTPTECAANHPPAIFTAVVLFSFLLAILLPATPAVSRSEESKPPFAIIDPPIRAPEGRQIEIIEWFWYASPESYQSFSILSDWREQLPDDVKLRRLPAVCKDDWAILADFYLALEKLGLAASLHERVYQAVIRDGLNWLDERYLFDWIDRQGVDVASFVKTFRSDEVYRNRLFAEQLGKSANLTEVPAFLVQGKYLITTELAGGISHFPDALNRAIAKARQELNLQ